VLWIPESTMAIAGGVVPRFPHTFWASAACVHCCVFEYDVIEVSLTA
jgi:hypothetical protein